MTVTDSRKSELSFITQWNPNHILQSIWTFSCGWRYCTLQRESNFL